MYQHIIYVEDENEKELIVEHNDTTTEPTGEGVNKTNLDGDYIYRNAHKNDIWGTVIKNGDWVRLRDWTYYKLQELNTWYWKQTSYIEGENDINYANGESHWIIKKYDILDKVIINDI